MEKITKATTVSDSSAKTVDVTIVSDASEELVEIFAHIQEHPLLALDCEGVDLGRRGRLSLVQLSTPERSFLFDVLEASPDSEMVTFLKSVLENPDIIKIIHDCKMDADALFHIYDITLRGVHDTQVWDKVLMGGREQNLNNTLRLYSCTPNVERDGSVYERNFSFWATRPLTSHMIEWASGDIANLFALRDAQLRAATRNPARQSFCETESEKNASLLPGMLVRETQILGSLVGKFIGRGGSNLRSIQAKAPGTFFQFRGKRNSGLIHVYAESQASIDRALRLLRPYQI